MGQTLTYGVYLPDEGERNCYSGLANNWQILDDAVGAIAGKANDSNVVHKTGDETTTGFKQFANIRANNSIKAINLDSTTTDLDNCYSDFAPSAENKGGNIQYYYCNTDAGTANISNLPEAKAFFLTSITTRLISNSLYVKQILINSNSKTFTRYCANSTWSSWINETDSEYVHKSGAETIGGAKTWTANQTFKGNIQQYFDAASNTTPATNQFNTYNTVGSDNGVIISQQTANRTTGQRDVSTRVYATDNTFNGYQLVKDANNNYSFSPIYTNTVALGTSSLQWKSVSSQTYYYNGTAWGLDQSNVWTGNNTFTSTITTKANVVRTVAPASDVNYGTIICRDKNNSAMFRMQGTIKTDLSNVWDMMMVAPNSTYHTFFVYKISSVTFYKELRLKADSIIPDTNSSELGTSTNKWKSFNGVNPGVLGFPGTSYTDIDTDGWSISGSYNEWTAPLDGWIYIRVTGGSDAFVTIRQVSYSPVNPTITFVGSTATNNVSTMLPVVANRYYRIYINTTAIEQCKFIPCLGNV